MPNQIPTTTEAIAIVLRAQIELDRAQDPRALKAGNDLEAVIRRLAAQLPIVTSQLELPNTCPKFH